MGRPGEGMPFGKGSPSPVPPSPRKLLFWSVQGNLRAVSLPSATVSGGAAAPVRRPYPGIPERMGPLAWLHCRSCCDEILILAGIVLRAWVLPEGEGVLWNLSLGQGPQLMRGLVCRRRAGQRHAVLLEEMRGGDGARCAEGVLPYPDGKGKHVCWWPVLFSCRGMAGGAYAGQGNAQRD